MMKKIFTPFVLGLSFAGLSACAHTSKTAVPSASASEKISETASFDVKTVTCWDILTVAEEDLNMAMMLIYGYTQGESRRTEQSSASIEAAFTSAFAYCEANPDAPAMNGFK